MGVYVITTFIFVVFGSAELQEWGVSEDSFYNKDIPPSTYHIPRETSPLLGRAKKAQADVLDNDS